MTTIQRLAGDPRRTRLFLDGVFLGLAVLIFGQVADPDILFHGIWVVLTLHAFLFGLRVTALRIGLAMLMLVAYFTIGASTGPDDPGFLQLDLAEWPLMIVIAILVAVMADQVAATGRYYADLYSQASDRLLTAQEDERKRLGRDLHDGVGQTLTAMTLTLDAAESVLWAGERAPSELSRTAIRRAQELAAIAIEDTHEVALRLRPGRLVETGLVAALRWLGTTAGAPVTVHADASLARPGLLPADDEINLYRIVQEAINNAVRYAQAGLITVSVSADPGSVTVIVSDDGVGFDPDAAMDRGLGLAGMRERAIALDATFDLDSAPGRGSRVTVRVPRPALTDGGAAVTAGGPVTSPGTT